MRTPPGYEPDEAVHRGPRSAVTRATRLASGERVVLKVSAANDGEASARSHHEHHIAAPIRSVHVVKALGFEHYDDRVVLIQEAFGNGSLAELLNRGAIDVQHALELGVQIASGLAEIHAHHVTHRAIHPGNIVVDSHTFTAKIIDFAQASVLHESGSPEQLEDSAIPLAYISPEQTGRMNRKVDYRSDLYSLGATLYHVLAGRPPFVATDPLALVHAHIALPHVSLAELDARVPRQLSLLVDKLLAKNAEDRYQSARGVVGDLRECARQYGETHDVQAFTLGREDLSDRFLIPQKLYGRGAERAQLLEAIADAAGGGKQLLLVSGYSGIGKSSLVDEIHKPIVERRGTFAAGKFDPLKRHAPYSALAEALTQLCRGLLRLPEAELAVFRRRILERVGGNAGLISDLVRDLERIVGPQPAVPVTGLVESQHRFHLTLSRFLGAFVLEGRPLVLFLDDLQWADPATLHAIGAILRLPEPTHLLVIGAYRDNEVDAGHPLSIALDEYRRASVEIRKLQLTGLSDTDVCALVADTLRGTPVEVQPLAQLVAEMTSGNPFFVAEFMRTLHEEQALRFEPERRAFGWSLPQVEALGIRANVVELMLRKLERLPPATREALQLAAAAGAHFDLDLLSEATGLTATDMRARLAPAIRERLLVPLDPNYPIGLVDVSSDDRVNYRYRFLHDRVQQAAYESLPEAERPALHLQLGRILAAHSSPELRNVFDIVNQLNRGAELLQDRAERTRLAKMNLEAGERARTTTAYHEARAYLGRGVTLLDERAWHDDYTLACTLHLRYAECAYLAGHFDEAGAFSDALLPKLQSALEKAQLYSIRIVLETNRGQFGRALTAARAALEVLGHPLPSMRTPLPLLAARARVLLALKLRPDLSKLPQLSDPRLIAVVDVLSHVYAPAYFGDQKQMFFWAVHENLRIAIEHGVCPATAAGYTNYGSFLIAGPRDYEGALAIGKLALELAARSDAFALRAQVLHVVGATSYGYAYNHLRTCIPLLERAFEHGLESGDMLYTCFAAAVLPDLRFMVGDPIDDVCREAELRERAIRSFQQAEMSLALRMFRQCMRCLRGETNGRTSLSTSDVDEDALVAEMRATPGQLALHFYSMCKVILCTLLGDYAGAVRLILAADAAIEGSMSALVRLTEYAFFACVALGRCLHNPAFDRRALRRLLDDKSRRLARWAETAPMNFRHKQQLVEAELADHAGHSDRATLLYDAAMRDAAANGFNHHAAFAAELASRSFNRRGLGEVARAYRQAARSGYARWGALAKVRALDEAYPELAAKSVPLARPALPLDTLSVLRASQALTDEIELKALLERILRVIVQTAGAQRGALLVEHAGQLHRQAQLDIQHDRFESEPTAASESEPRLPEAIVRYCLRTGEDLVLADAAHNQQFADDPYVAAHASRSVLCMPVRHRDRVTGVLLLENDLSSDVFTRERLETLRLLVAQAAISLENARLYEATQKLNVELAGSEALLRGFLDGLPLGVHVVDRHGQLAFSNRAAVEILGKQLDPATGVEALATQHRAYVSGSDRPYPVELMPIARALRGERTMIEDMELRLPERSVPLAIWGTPIYGDDGAVRYALVAFQDISAKRAVQASHARLEEQLRQAERLESIGRLAGGVAHDFNNLLTPILAYSDMARGQLPRDAPLRFQLDQIYQAADQAAELTRQLLAFGRRQVLDTRIVDLNQELTRFESMLRRLIRENIQLVLRLDADLRLVLADPIQIHRIVMNLALNAADAMPRGGTLVIETQNRQQGPPPTAADSELLGACAVLRVIDTGHGMDSDTLAKIFDPFFTTKHPGEGTGLGLATVYGLVQQHGGKLAVHSAPNLGSTFEVFLPHARAGSRERARPSEPAPLAQRHKGLILVVEDDDAVRTVIREILELDGHRVITASGPNEALQLALNLPAPLDLLVTDVVMPIMNGRDLYTELSRQAPRLAVLFISGYSGDAISANGLLEAGIDFMQKPLQIDALRTRVGEILERRLSHPA